jgi:hypothetical protein
LPINHIQTGPKLLHKVTPRKSFLGFFVNNSSILYTADKGLRFEIS